MFTKVSPLVKMLSSPSVKIWLDKLTTPVHVEISLLFIGLLSTLAFTFWFIGESIKVGMKV